MLEKDATPKRCCGPEGCGQLGNDNNHDRYCIASACMAWRKAPVACHRCGGDGFIAHRGMCDAEQCPMWADHKNPAALTKDRGYCGLAGKES